MISGQRQRSIDFFASRGTFRSRTLTEGGAVKKTLVLGGTKGLGRAIAKRSLAEERVTVVVGRSTLQASSDPELTGAEFFMADLANMDLMASNMNSILRSCGPFDRVFTVAGTWLNGPVIDCAREEIQEMVNLHLFGLVESLKAIHRFVVFGEPLLGREAFYHLVVVSSTSAYKRRKNEAVYRMVQAGKAAFVRSFAEEVCRDLPGSRVMLVEPGGMDTDFFGDGRSREGYMDPDVVAQNIFERMAEQDKRGSGFDECRMERGAGGEILIFDGSAKPEPPLIP